MKINSSTFELIASPPFRLDLTVWALRRRATNNIDLWNHGRYSRIIVVDHAPIRMDIIQNDHDPVLQIILKSASRIDTKTEESARSLAKEMIGLTLDLRPFYALAEKNDVLRPLVREFMGVKPPRFPTLFEALANAITSQQISLDAAIGILNRFSEHFGIAFENDDSIPYSFPLPDDLAVASEEEIRKVGFSRQKARLIKQIARNIQFYEAALADANRMADAAIMSYLSSIKGFGRWSAEYLLLRFFGRLDVFPKDDVGAKNNIQRLFNLDERPNYEEIKELTSNWQPYQGLVYFHLLLKNLRKKGVI